MTWERRVLRSALCIAAVVFACVLACAVPAWADGEEDKNTIDTSLLPDSSFIYETSIYALQTSDTYYEGQTIQITGEVVGDIINVGDDGGHVWITVNALPGEQAASVQVFISAEQAESIDMLGGFERTGTIVSIIGKYHLTCDQHEGLSDVHATSLDVLQQGSSHHTSFSLAAFLAPLALVVGGFALLAYYRRKREELR